MTEVFNWHDTWFVVTSNWIWITVALGLGVWVGWTTSAPDEG